MLEKLLKGVIACVVGVIASGVGMSITLIVYVAIGEFFLRFRIITPDLTMTMLRTVFVVYAVLFSVLMYRIESRVLRTYRSYNPT